MRTTSILSLLLTLSTTSLHAQTCNGSIEAVAPDSRYTDHGDGTVTDHVTGLMWKKCSEGQSGNDCSGGAATTHTWQGALQIPATVNISGGFAGYSDWRLPNNKELGSLVEERCYDPSINTTLFPNALVGIYWSSSPTINISAAMGFQFFYGTDYSNSRFVSYYVRLVRAGQ